LTITLRTILIAAAAPTSPPAHVAFMPSSRSSGSTASACGPASSIGVWWRAGCTGAMTATST
jgi:hypothetical protein